MAAGAITSLRSKEVEMHRSKKQRIEDGIKWVAATLETFLDGKAELFDKSPSVYILGYTNKEKMIMRDNKLVSRILSDLAVRCPVFEKSKTGKVMHIHNYGVSLITKYSNEYYVRKVNIEDRRALMAWARENCEIFDTRTSEFPMRSAEIVETTNFDNVIHFKF